MADENREQILREKGRFYRPGEMIFEGGAVGDCLYVVVTGCVELSRPGTGRPPEARHSGDFFGEAGVFSGATRSERAVALEPTTLLPVPSEELEAMCRACPEIGWRMMGKMCERHEAFREGSQAGERSASALLSEAILEAAAGDDAAGLRVKQTLDTLAESAGLTMTGAYRAVHDLIDRKQVRLEEDVLVILEPELLRDAAEPAVVQAGSKASQDRLAEGAAV
ncbi:MAG: hypothetical protein CL936_01770 [Deltaproteobacteria bacterium]|nr:hypothetical protein [Deltaproteobacteria bacterium]